MNWFDVDKEGLAKLLEGRPKSFVIYELVQNAWDTKAGQVEIRLEKIPGTPKAKLMVIDDDPDGFKRFSDAWTLYAESTKKDNPGLRGIYGEGEIMTLAMCYTATIKSTTGTVTFDNKGRHHSKSRTEKGSYFQGTIRMNQEEFDECCAAVRRLIPPSGIKTYFNTELLLPREALATFNIALATTIGDENGYIRPTTRKTDVVIYEPLEGEEAHVYEMGIPVVPTGDKWHVDVQQRVPLNRDRDNVTPAYLKILRTMVVNAMYERIPEEEAQGTWVVEAVKNKHIEQEAYDDIQKKRHGENAVIHDMNEPEATARSQAEGRPIIYGRSMSEDEFDNNRRFGTFQTAPEVTPVPKPFSEDGDPLKTMPQGEWSPGMKRIAKLAEAIQFAAHNTDLIVVMANDPGWRKFDACFGGIKLTLNVRKLGRKWFDEITDRQVSLIIHELAHYTESNHLSERYYRACCDVGAAAAILARSKPKLFAHS
jgi:hypothetical protein